MHVCMHAYVQAALTSMLACAASLGAAGTAECRTVHQSLSGAGRAAAASPALEGAALQEQHD